MRRAFLRPKGRGGRTEGRRATSTHRFPADSSVGGQNVVGHAKRWVIELELLYPIRAAECYRSHQITYALLSLHS